MKIAIIGAGNVGKALGASIQNAGHEVVIAASRPERAEAVGQEIGASPAEGSAAAVRDADIVILAVPYAALGDVTGAIREAVSGRVVVDVINPLKPDYSGLATNGSSAAEEIQERLPEARVVKAFNTVFAANQANPRPDVDVFVAGDDQEAKRKVLDLAGSMGFSQLDVGPLSNARYLEGMAYINIGLNAQNGWSWTSTWKLER